MSISMGVILGSSVLPASGCNPNSKSEPIGKKITAKSVDDAARQTREYGFAIFSFGKLATAHRKEGKIVGTVLTNDDAYLIVDLDKIATIKFVPKGTFKNNKLHLKPKSRLCAMEIESNGKVEKVQVDGCIKGIENKGNKGLYYELPLNTIDTSAVAGYSVFYLKVVYKEGRVLNFTIEIKNN